MVDPAHRTVLNLQRSAGNRAVTRTLARYESAEHRDLGDEYARALAIWVTTPEGQKWVKSYGLEEDVEGMPTDWIALGKRRIGGGPRTMTPGEIIALMGDFYETWQDLAAAKLAEVNEFTNAIALESEHKLDNPNARYEEITKKHRSNKNDHYLALAQRNSSHFTPGNRKQWLKLHLEALRLAEKPTPAGEQRFSGNPSHGLWYDKSFEKALFIDAAAGHFLTDAFAAGHLFDKDRIEAEITHRLKSRPALASNPEMQGYLAIVGLKNALPQLVLKNIHDRMNREGFDVTNGRGMRWRTYGDVYLTKAPDTQRIAALAIYVSRQQVYKARAGKNPNPDRVLSFLPDAASVQRANVCASRYIDTAIDEVGELIYRQRSMAKAQFGGLIGAIISSNINTIGNPGRNKQLLDAKERQEQTKQNQAPPQFTIFNF